MTGFDKKSLALRTQEFKGMVRFWWRAAHSTKNIEQLKNAESEIFGGISDNSQKSRILIRVCPTGVEDFKTESVRFKEGYTGMVISQNSSFILSILSYDDSAFKQALAAFWLASFLGGFGRRSRRFMGNISISCFETNFQENLDLDFNVPKVDSSIELKNWILKNAKSAIRVIHDCSKIQADIKSEMAGFSNIFYLSEIFEETKDIIISKNGFQNIDLAEEDFTKKYDDIMKSNDFVTYPEAVTGLPLIKQGKKGRRASPFIFKLIKTIDDNHEEKYFWMVVRLHGKYSDKDSNNELYLRLQNAFVDKLNEVEAKS